MISEEPKLILRALSLTLTQRALHFHCMNSPWFARRLAALVSAAMRRRLGTAAQVCKHPLQPPVLFLHRLHMADQRRIHPAILRAPCVKRRASHAMLAAQLSRGTPPSACRRIAMICALVYLLVFIRILRVHFVEKIRRLQPLKFGGITTRLPPYPRRLCARSRRALPSSLCSTLCSESWPIPVVTKQGRRALRLCP